MMKLAEILGGTKISGTPGCGEDTIITGISSDSRTVSAGNMFVALPGPKTYGGKFINDAVTAGASLVVHKKGDAIGPVPPGVQTIAVADPHQFLADSLKVFYKDPAKSLRLIGITGTNGKTTLTYLLESLFAAAGKACGVVGTVNFRYAGKVLKAGNTTPGLVENYSLLAKMVESGIKYCAMEVSSHALDQRRVEGLDFRYAVFTNLTSDHLDYHKDQETYFRAKAKLFTALSKNNRAIINIDDPFGPRLKSMSAAPVWTYSTKVPADITARGIELSFDRTCFELVGPGGSAAITTRLIGLHNIYNVLAAAGVAMAEKLPMDVIKKGIEALPQVPGRLERIEAGQDFHVFVDYAHTEDALKNVLSSIRQVSKARVIVVFGCGGDRDRTKRPKMAAVVESLSDFAIVTNDNPRTEDPQQIIKEILNGFKRKNYKVVADREEAIAEALGMARSGDVVLIAGKGHEDYQIFKDRTVPFDERQVVRKHLTSSRR